MSLFLVEGLVKEEFRGGWWFQRSRLSFSKYILEVSLFVGYSVTVEFLAGVEN